MTICNLKIHTPEYITFAISVLMIKLAAFGLLGLLVVLILPANADEQTPSFLYGAATLVAYDAHGNEFFAQTVHNQLFDAGEDFMIDQSFTDIGTDVANAIQIGAICLSADTTETTNEPDTAATFNTDNVRAGDTVAENCVTDILVTKAAQVVTIGPETFTAGADVSTVQWVGGNTVTSIGICPASATDSTVRDCTTTLFAVVDTSDVTLAASETVDVTYTFDISDNSS